MLQIKLTVKLSSMLKIDWLTNLLYPHIINAVNALQIIAVRTYKITLYKLVMATTFISLSLKHETILVKAFKSANYKKKKTTMAFDWHALEIILAKCAPTVNNYPATERHY